MFVVCPYLQRINGRPLTISDKIFAVNSRGQRQQKVLGGGGGDLFIISKS